MPTPRRAARWESAWPGPGGWWLAVHPAEERGERVSRGGVVLRSEQKDRVTTVEVAGRGQLRAQPRLHVLLVGEPGRAQAVVDGGAKLRLQLRLRAQVGEVMEEELHLVGQRGIEVGDRVHVAAGRQQRLQPRRPSTAAVQRQGDGGGARA